MGRYEIAIIGTGPAGLEAAITATVRNKKVLLLGSRESSLKVSKAHKIANYLGLPEIAGADLAAAYLKHIDAMGIQITEDKINAIYSMGDYFVLQGNENVMYEADAVILATGVVAGKPFPGEDENLGRGVSYCATCDAALYRGKSAVVIGYAPKEEPEAEFLAEIADKVTYLAMYPEETSFTRENVEVLRVKPLSIVRDGRMKLVTDQGEIESDGVFVLREAISPKQLVPGLATDGPHVTVDLQMRTNLPGCFACGDIAGTPYQYIKAAGQGNVAALSAVSYLDMKKRSGGK
ncbi:MAG: NAD(P)/FAD-dependent oxidoreductase [Lachnospiraceae bacterium]|nr:NAD(P)/FAD-dependent oxidoreductase [Lachnospiraceae bacterium]